MIDVLGNTTAVIIRKYINYQINTLYTLNMYHVVCQLSPLKTNKNPYICTLSSRQASPKPGYTWNSSGSFHTVLLHRSTPVTTDSQFWLPEGECIIFTISQVTVICQQFWKRLRAYALNYLITIPRLFFSCLILFTLFNSRVWKAFASLLYLRISNPYFWVYEIKLSPSLLLRED